MDRLIFIRETFPTSDEEFKTFSIRIEETVFHQIIEIAKNTDRSKNNIINLFLDYSLERYEIILDPCKTVPYGKSKTIFSKETPLSISIKQRQPKTHTTFSIRLALPKFKRIKEIAQQANISKNKVICCFIQFGLEQCEIKQAEE